MTSRRDFIQRTGLAGVAGTLLSSASATSPPPRVEGGIVAIASGNGEQAVRRAVEMMRSGADALDAVVAGVNLVEEDPEDVTVGYGGLPNFDGVVELDSCVMHGPTARAGAVAALRDIVYPSRVARTVMKRTDHVLLVGEGARRFALMHGYTATDLLTEKARQIWLEWREGISNEDDYLPEHSMEDKDIGSKVVAYGREYGTIHCSGIDEAGNLSGVTTTSGLSFKIPGRVGDSPIIGAGLYVDNNVGAAGSTGRGEANLENLSTFLIVEQMRTGASPQEACLVACRRIVDNTRLARLKDDRGRPDFNVRFYAVNKDGDFGGAEIHDRGGVMAVADANGSRMVPLKHLYGRAD